MDAIFESWGTFIIITFLLLKVGKAFYIGYYYILLHAYSN